VFVCSLLIYEIAWAIKAYRLSVIEGGGRCCRSSAG